MAPAASRVYAGMRLGVGARRPAPETPAFLTSCPKDLLR